MSHAALVEQQSPPSTYAIAALLDGEPGAAQRVAVLTLQRAVIVGLGLWAVGIRGGSLTRGALAGSAAITAWIAAGYALRSSRPSRAASQADGVSPNALAPSPMVAPSGAASIHSRIL